MEEEKDSLDNPQDAKDNELPITLEFKKPILIDKVGKLPKSALDGPSSNEPVASGSVANSGLPPNPIIPIPYKEPVWSGQCPDGSDYALEVVKGGMVVEEISLTSKPFFVFGRYTNCDIILGHPTISRYHAVLQYKAFAQESEPPAGWYLHDLGSSHGTYLNKARVKNRTFIRMRVGHYIRFGSSTRTYILNGPGFDSEGETELTVTEIKTKALLMRKERDKLLVEAKALRDRDRTDAEKRKAEMGIDWGMGEDAEDEVDLTDNPYAVTSNEELYLEDPKKTLRGYYEREGLELVYDCEERGQGQFVCRVELPIDDARGRPVKAEVIHKGKKKEAVVACALEACRILDRAGLLRQATHESRRKKERDWSADDYYDSDDDNFLDRTGSVEKKRDARMKKFCAEASQSTSEAPLTYDTLQEKIKEIQSKIAIEEKSLKRLREVCRSQGSGDAGEDGDPLDNYMQSLAKQGPTMAQKADISNTKMLIKKLEAELAKSQRLAELARPAHLPPLIKKDQSKLTVKVASNSVVYGKRMKLKDDVQNMKPKPKESKTQNDSEFVEEMDSEDDEIEKPTDSTSDTNVQITPTTNSSNDSKKEKSQTEQSNQHTDSNGFKAHQTKSETVKDVTERHQVDSKTDQIDSNTDQIKSKSDQAKSEIKNAGQKKQYGPMRPPDNYVLPESYFEQTSDRDLPEIVNEV